MRFLLLTGLLAAAALPLHAQKDVPPLPVAPPAGQGTLSFDVVLVGEQIPEPIPGAEFRVTLLASQQNAHVFRTDTQGAFTAHLLPGAYLLETARPFLYAGKAYTWKKTFTLAADKVSEVKLTDADAVITDRPAERPSGEEAKVFAGAKEGVVTVDTDFGSSSGFVVEKRGLILTSDDRVHGTRWTDIRFGRGLRFAAAVVAEDPQADAAVLAFNPADVGDVTALPLADTSQGAPVAAGDKVLVIGCSPEQEKTLASGSLARAEDGALYSDAEINQNNAGGPVLTMTGQVVGLATDVVPGGADGPGIAGIVPISKASPVLQSAIRKLSTLPSPPTNLLPDISPVAIPGPSLIDAEQRDVRPVEIHAPKGFATLILTPFIIASQTTAGDRALSKAKGVKYQPVVKPNRFWTRYAGGPGDALVSIEIRPIMRGVSETRSVFGVILGGLSGIPFDTSAGLKFRDGFHDMELYHGDTLIPPIRRYRLPVAELYQDESLKAGEPIFGGLYCYDPSAFDPRQSLTIRMRRESNLTQWDEIKIAPKDQKRIWDEFASYRDALHKTIARKYPAGTNVGGDISFGFKRMTVITDYITGFNDQAGSLDFKGK